ncbi:MAG: hypothetical protein JJE09_06890 [Bacteroidia bacterium]|nr:hypothetical protein [Bacteroidia bacterium]
MKRILYCLIVLVLNGCSSGKSAYKHGDYYDAVLTAVQRLRQNPDHKKSREILKLSYQPAVDYLETDVQNQINSNANFKYSAAVRDYEKINNLYEQIRASPGALKVVPSPKSKYKELTDMKNKAAEESYEAGIQSMMRSSRQDAKDAYFYFSDANIYVPGYRESIEMIEKAKFNATLKVIVESGLGNLYDWNFDPVIFGYTANQFVKFYTPRNAEDNKIGKADQFLKVIVNGYKEGFPSISKRVEEQKDSVKTGEKTVNGKKVPAFEQVSAKVTIFEKKVTARGSLTLLIVDGENKAELRNADIASDVTWTDSWAIYSGDLRALGSGNKKLVERREPNMGRDYLRNQTKVELDKKLAEAMRAFYQNF